MEAATSLSALRAVLVTDGISPAFQPIVDLADGRVVGYEALARGPVGSPLHSPADLFAAAHAEGLLVETDIACQAAALRAAISGGLRSPMSIFVNIEPAAVGALPDSLRDLYAAASAQLRVVVEVTERALTARPADLLARVQDMRALGCEIALDDVGADARSLAMMAVLEPEVIKLDLALVQRHPDADVAAVVSAVGAEAERTGATIIVEGIETAAQRDAGLAMGGVLGQGWFYGRPTPLPTGRISPTEPARAPRRPALSVHTPFELAAGLDTRVSTKPLLFAMSRHIETQAASAGGNAVVLATFQTAEYMTAATRQRYGRLADGTAYCAALATALEAEPAPGVQGIALSADDPLAQEWDIAVVSPHFACLLVAQDLGDTGPDDERRFRYALSYDRRLAVAAARALFARISGH